MEQAQQLIQAYRLGFNISLGVTILGVISAIFIFVKFDIRTIFSIQTGRAAQKTIEKMATENAKTGRLRQEDNMFTDGLTTAQISGEPTDKIQSQAMPRSTGAEQTSVLSENQQPTAPIAVAASAPTVQPGFQFTITENVVIIHTNDLI